MERIIAMGTWKHTSFWGCLVVIAVVAAGRGHAASPAHEPRKLGVLAEEYPRVFFFRQAEGVAAQQNVSYEQWERTFERLMGIEGKVLEEEVPGRSIRNIDFFTRFKNRHPEQLVLLHFNGNARDPRYESNKFFAGHWVYFNGARILSDVPAEEGETNIRIDEPGLFKVNMGRYQDQNEDIGLCALDAEGRPDWHQSEQVQLVSVDLKNKTIRVRRGCYGTKPQAFRGGASYATAHLTEGPWGKQSHLLWYYNYSTRCPRDKNGLVCADVLVEHLSELFGPGGALAAFDGLEFDVLKWNCGGGLKGRGADCDADGRADAGLQKGVSLYGAGVVEFCRRLRERLGDTRLILADGMGLNNQRAFGILNGIESEGWPHLSDHAIRDWSGGLNRHLFWDRNAQPPIFNYINHKFNVPSGKPGVTKQADVPFSTHRLVFAVAAFTNSAICYSYAPRNDADGLLGIWDEFRMGAENRLGWLGKPLGPAVRMATRTPDLLENRGTPITAGILQRFTGDAGRLELSERAMKVSAVDPKASEIRFRLGGVRCSGPDLFISVTARGDAMEGYPADVARLMYVGACPPGGKVESDNRFMTWVNGADFDSGFYFSTVDSNQIDLEFAVEGSEPVWIRRIQAHAHPDAIYREFEKGLVVANPSPRPYLFELDALLPGRSFRRLRGSSTQDAASNDGSIIRGPLSLGPKEGLFLVRVD
jgi:hypothetical protein